MTVNMPPPRGPLPPVAQVLAEAALQRQSALLGPPGAGGTSPLPGAADTAAVPTPLAVPVSVPEPAEQAHISPQARAPLGAGFDPRNAAQAPGSPRAAGPLPTAAAPQPRGGAAAALLAGAPRAAPVGQAWPAAGLDVPLRQLVTALVQQLTAPVAPQRVVAAQAWPLALAHALESGEADATQPALQTWLVRQGSVQTPEGPRGLAATLRVPVPWLAAQAAQPGAMVSAALQPPGALQVPYTGPAQGLQSGVLALVLQGLESGSARTSALLVLDFQPPLAAAVYGRDMVLARLDPWLQLAQLQASGQLPRDDDLAREREAGLCKEPGCPYAGRAACAQPFCLAMSVVAPVAPVEAGPGSV